MINFVPYTDAGLIHIVLHNSFKVSHILYCCRRNYKLTISLQL